MNKKKALFTSLAALALASTQAQTFAEEVDATIAEPTVAEVPAVDEVAQDALVAEEPVAEAVAEEPVEETPATDAIAEEAVAEEPVLATRAVEEEVPVTTFAAASAGAEVVATDEERFDQVLTDYQQFLMADSASSAVDAFGYSFSIEGYTVSDRTKMGYAFYDVDWDGQNELLTSYFDSNSANVAYKESFTEVQETFGPRIYDIYGTDVSGQVVPLYTFAGGKGGMTLMEDGTIWRGEQSTNLISVEEWTLDESGRYEVLDSIMSDNYGADYRSLTYGDTYTSAELLDYINQVKPVNLHNLTWKRVLDYTTPVVEQPVREQAPAVTAIAGDATPEPAQPSVEIVETANEVVAQPAQEQAPAVTAIAGDATPETAQPSVEVVEEPATSPVNKPVQTPFSPIAGQWVNGYGDIIEISETGEMYFGGIRISPESFTTQLEVYAGFDNEYLTGVTGVQGISYLADTDQLRLSLPIGWAPLADEEAEKAAREDFTKLTLYSRVTAVNTSSVAEELVAQPVVAETVAPTTSEVVQVPVSVKAETAPAPSQPAQATYQRTAKAQSDKGFLPSTGEAVSILGILGAGLSALGLAGLKRRK